MKKVVTSEEMREIDTRTIKELGLPGPILMERAGIAVTDVALKILEVHGGNHAAIFCGKGNNGGDGFVVAREMLRSNIAVDVYVFAPKKEIKGDALLNLNALVKLGLEVKYVNNIDELDHLTIEADIIIDALLGTGIKGKVTGILGEAIRFINDLYKPVLSIDLPSGINADTGTFEGECVKADFTVTMGLVKRGLVIPPGKEYSGEVFVADIGFPDFVVSEKNINVNILEERDIRNLIPLRHLDVHKGDFGKIFCLAGSAGFTGAAYMACESMVKTGAGLVVLGIPKSLNCAMEAKLTETMTVPLPETEAQSFSFKALDEILERIKWADIFVLGPGISRNEETQKLILEVVKKTDIPTIIDADGLFPFKNNLDILKNTKAQIIITPHEGEFSRIFKVGRGEIYYDRIEIMLSKQKMINGTILLKGTATVIASPDEKIFINVTGNPGMASGGTGDVLTGIIAGLAAQKIDFALSAAAGAYIHGLAGDLAAEEMTEYPVTATDLIHKIPEVYKRLFLPKTS